MATLSDPSVLSPTGAADAMYATEAANFAARQRSLMLGSDAKLLALMSNASALRGRLLPSLVELHHPLMAGEQ